MDSPYRSAPGTQQAQRPRDAGIVGDIIEQFADRFAFLRELIQNSIDANTASIDVTLRYDDAQKILTISVEDYGDGMPREIIEDGLLVLFRSTKENDESKIGKFGIGFVSVLAVDPGVVRVISNHGGDRHTLHLYPDFSYELFDSGRTTKTGTTVELEISLEPDKVEDFATASWQALYRWCRHATVMISMSVYASGGRFYENERVDRPLALDGALASVQRTTDDGQISAVVGLTEQPYVAFFNHGLLLYETREPLLGNISFVIQDARLGHTLSRDNVRRDGNFDTALDFVRDLAEHLPAEIVRKFYGALDDNESGDYHQLASAVYRSGIEIDHAEWPLPLIEPLGSKTSTTVEAHRDGWRWTAHRASALTAALAAVGTPVVSRGHATRGPFSDSEEWQSQLPHGATTRAFEGEDDGWFSDLCGPEREVHQHLTLVRPVDPTNFDLVLVDMLSDLLDQVWRRPSKVVLAKLEGAYGSAFWVAGGRDSASMGGGLEETWILDSEKATRNPFRVLRRPALVLNCDSARVRAARSKAHTEPYFAAEMLARFLLLDREKLDSTLSEELLEHGLDGLLRGTR
jgi:molecular chaperone HtpG